MLVIHRPGPLLSPFVEAIWQYEGQHIHHNHHTERVLPNGRFQIIINVAGGRAAVVGLRSASTLIRPTAIQSAIGVVFQPGGARRFFREPASDFYNTTVPLDDLSGNSRFSRLADRVTCATYVEARMQVIEAMLLAMIGHPKHRPLHPAIEYALRQFRHAPNVATVVGVSRQVGLSRRWLAQTFNQQIGMTPKKYCRLMRFRSIVRHIASNGTVDWAATAVAGGYYDQAHLAHEFRQFSGMTPSSYLAAERPYPNHVRVQ